MRYQEVEMYPYHRHISPTTLLIFITIFVFSTFSLVNSMYKGHKSQDQDFDVLIFSQNWPVSVCEKYISTGKDHSCYRFPNNSWTIHGLWPTKIGEIGPNFCDKSKHFNPEAIFGIETELEKYWSPVQNHHKKYAFWSHEWEKHGTCASVLPQFSTEFDYFYTVLKLLNQYNMNEILLKAGVSPGNTYNVTEIWDGVKKVLLKNPQVICFEENGQSVLMELRICLQKNMTLTDCDGTVVGGKVPRIDMRRSRGRRAVGYHNLTNCKIEKLVRYPPGFMRQLPQIINEENPAKESQHPLLGVLKIINFAQWFSG